jgi:FkbM family methyltransferase
VTIKNKAITYAQFNEDVILDALFSGKKDGFYVDVGANHEELHSVTKYFYKLGWRGINIDPIKKLIQEFDERRPRDINLNIAISDIRGRLKFREYIQHDGLSTFSEKTMNENEGKNYPYIDYFVPVKTLESVLRENNVTEIDFLKIDVEGYEDSVIRSNDWNVFRPKVLCVEANHRSSDWNASLLNKGYKLAIFDGLNEYYVLDMKMLDGFAERAALIKHHTTPSHIAVGWKKDKAELKKANKDIEALSSKLNSLQQRLEENERNIKSIKYLTKRQIREIGKRLGIE